MISNEQKFTGKTPTDKPNILLSKAYSISTPVSPDTPKSTKYIQIFSTPTNYVPYPFNKDSIYRSIPNFNQTLPTPQEVEIGQYTRYFCKKNNELIYLEIDKNTFTQLQNREPKIAWDLYTPTSIIWNTRLTELSTNTSNSSSVLKIEKDLKWYGFFQYFKGNFN
jgi:hypothetical protein